MTNLTANDFQIPVCIADLPASDFQVDPETLTESVVTELENNPELPGVLIVRNHKLLGFITRLKLFERLAHRYGVELFLRKPIRELSHLCQQKREPLPGHLRVDEAVQRALQRPASDIYDPVVVEYKPHLYRMLDMNVLVLAQSRTVSNLSNIVNKLQQIDNLIHQNWERTELLQRMLRLLGQVVPFHQALILVQHGPQLQLAAEVGFGRSHHSIDFSALRQHTIYQMTIKHRQALYLPDASRVPAWKELKGLGHPTAWLGVPLLNGEQPLGLLSLGRNIPSPFTPDEKETCQSFAQRIVKLLLRRERNENTAAQPDDSPSSYFNTLMLLDAEGVY